MKYYWSSVVRKWINVGMDMVSNESSVIGGGKLIKMMVR
jgi:hypothetical protein